MDDRLGLRWEMRSPRLEIVNAAMTVGQAGICFGSHQRVHASVEITAQNRGERGPVNPVTDAIGETTPGQLSTRSMHSRPHHRLIKILIDIKETGGVDQSVAKRS